MNATAENMNFFIATLQRNKFKATNIHTLLVEAWGEENVLSLRRIQEISKDFACGERQAFVRADGSGRPRDVRTPENIEAIKNIVDNDQTVSIAQISQNMTLTWSTIQRILTDDLHKINIYARWVPHHLTEIHKNLRVDGAKKILNEINGSIVVIDENMLYSRPIQLSTR